MAELTAEPSRIPIYFNDNLPLKLTKDALVAMSLLRGAPS